MAHGQDITQHSLLQYNYLQTIQAGTCKMLVKGAYLSFTGYRSHIAYFLRSKCVDNGALANVRISNKTNTTGNSSITILLSKTYNVDA